MRYSARQKKGTLKNNSEKSHIIRNSYIAMFSLFHSLLKGGFMVSFKERRGGDEEECA
jgi:hypothetical protein